jgi:transposase
MYKELSDEFWKRVEPLLELFKRTRPGGSPPLPFRTILNGIFYLLKTGCQWDMIPKCYGSKSTIHEHFQRWVSAGVFDEIFRLDLKEYEELQGIAWDWQSMDGSLVQAPTRQKGGACASEECLGHNPTDRGRSGTKIHILVDGHGIPLGTKVVGANVHDSRLVGSTIETIFIQQPQWTPEISPNLCLDKGYDFERVEAEVKQYGYQPHIRRIGEEKQNAEGEKQYPARRWVVERTLAWIKGFRSLRTRYFCKGQNYMAMLRFACSVIIFRALYPNDIWA